MEYPTQTAAMLEPYTDAKGKPSRFARQALPRRGGHEAVLPARRTEGFNIHVHAIGDAAVRETLNAIEAARAAGSKQLYSIAHLQSIDPATCRASQKLDTDRVAAAVLGAARQLQHRRPAAVHRGREAAAHLPGTLAAGGRRDGRRRQRLGRDSFNPFEAMATGMTRTNPCRAGARAP